tara:strand:+ start:340 stop:873 length:534 start_codon:yes stop_codon:yes gene_type:complete
MTTLTNIKINYGDGNCYYTSNGQWAGLEIHFRGIPNITPKLNEKWNYKLNKNILTILGTTFELPDIDLFGYDGELQIIRVIAIDWYKNKLIAEVENTFISTWNKTPEDYENGNFWGSYNKDYTIGVKNPIIKLKQRLTKEEKILQEKQAQWEARVPIDPSEPASDAYSGGGSGGGGL